MLQRIQTVWMLLAAICAALTFKFSFYSGNRLIGNNGHLFQSLTASTKALNLILTVGIIAGSLINIFNFKKRKQQLFGIVGLIIFSLLNIFLYYKAATSDFIEGTFDLTAIFSLVIPVLFLLAGRGIMRDERLVKSADRLR